MQILLVFCHPDRGSFQGTILTELEARLTRDGHVLRTLDLYGQGFDPILDLESWRAHRGGVSREDAGLSAHVAALRGAEGLIFLYPTWWYGLPAMLKGWLDRVWQPRIAFTLENGVFATHYLTRVRRFAAISTYGSPRGFIEWVVGDPVRRQLMRGLRLQFARGARVCWRPIYNVDTRTEAELAQARARAVAGVARLFAEA